MLFFSENRRFFVLLGDRMEKVCTVYFVTRFFIIVRDVISDFSYSINIKHVVSDSNDGLKE